MEVKDILDAEKEFSQWIDRDRIWMSGKYKFVNICIMMFENLLNKLAINLHKYFKNTRIMAENLRSPNSFFFGFIAKRLMLVGNQKVIEDSDQRLNIKTED